MEGSPLLRRLARGERLLWSGRPKQGILFTAADTLLIPFSLMWGGFAVFWETMVVVSGAPIFFWLWGVPFVLVGLYMIAGRFFHDAWLRRRTWYAVTERRVLILRTGALGGLTALDIGSLPDLRLKLGHGDRGSILFVDEYARRSPWRGRNFWGPVTGRAVQFASIPDAERVFELIIDRGR